MNYLAHCFLAPKNTEGLLGCFYGDFVRGTRATLARHYPADILNGIIQHRKVDQFTDQHPSVITSRRLFSKQRRRYSGIMLDVLYDHFLHRHWSRLTETPKSDLISSVYHLLEQNDSDLPPRLAAIAPRIIADDWLTSYQDIGVIGHVLERISTRISKANNLSGGIDEIRDHYEALEAHFLIFFPEAMSFAEEINSVMWPQLDDD